jgi:hypothetical protein
VPAGRARARGLGLGEVAESSVPAALSARNTAVMSKFQKTTAILCESFEYIHFFKYLEIHQFCVGPWQCALMLEFTQFNLFFNEWGQLL